MPGIFSQTTKKKSSLPPRRNLGGGGQRSTPPPPGKPESKTGFNGGVDHGKGDDCCPDDWKEFQAKFVVEGTAAAGYGFQGTFEYKFNKDDLLSSDNIEIGASQGWIGEIGFQISIGFVAQGSGIIKL